ncbi:MAG: hypothetical protein EOO52_04690 [Gammaproteobacteria bacterium]|nr:MAG: hypothetical protein EOO52_04690 [Gammaproteobacteria bacterium]
MHPIPEGYGRVADGDTIREGDLALGKVKSMCGQESYGWGLVAPRLIGTEFFQGAVDLGHPALLVRKIGHIENKGSNEG